MTSADLLIDAFGRIRDSVVAAVEGLSPDELSFRPDDGSNSVAWLAWHLTRVQDDHVAGVADVEQVYLTGGWVERFGFPFDPGAFGYGHTPDEVAAVRVESGNLLCDYQNAVYEQTVEVVRGVSDADLERIVDRRWDPPVTLGVRLVSVISDGLEHAGQAAYLRGLLLRRR
jgi:hypothetical protein